MQNKRKRQQIWSWASLIVFSLVVVLSIGKMMYEYYKKPWSGGEKIVPAEKTIIQDTSVVLALSTTGQIVHHKYYTLSYAEKAEQAEWVAYELTRESLKKENVPRSDYFDPDYAVKTRSSYHRDYTGSGYTRGHLVPAADMAFDMVAMKQTFLMSNISPQLKEFNNGVWRELEEVVRDWAWKNKSIYIVSGPILSQRGLRTIGKENKISVPQYFFKAILDLEEPEKKAIGFIVPHERSEEHLSSFMCSIDSLEAFSGIELFPNIEASLESRFKAELWPIDEERYNKRVKYWNNE